MCQRKKYESKSHNTWSSTIRGQKQKTKQIENSNTQTPNRNIFHITNLNSCVVPQGIIWWAIVFGECCNVEYNVVKNFYFPDRIFVVIPNVEKQLKI